MAKREGGEAHEPRRASGRPLKKIARRAILGGAVLGVVGEYLSFRGLFDHRRLRPASAASRYMESLLRLDAKTAGIIHVAHSTHVIALGGKRLLTDPWFFDPAFGALAHEVMPAAPPENLGPLDAILITHDHADHADLRAIDRMDKRATVIVATNDLAARVRALGFRDVTVLAPWETHPFGAVRVTAVPAKHDIYEIGYVVQHETHSVFFGGDTRLHDDLPAIAERYKPTFALLPVDGTRLTGGSVATMSPEDAVQAMRILGAKTVMPSHAEAVFSDPIAAHVLASTVAGARGKFAELVRRDLPAATCIVPQPADLVLL